METCYRILLQPHGHSRQLSRGEEQVLPVHFSYRYDNMHDRMPNKHMQRHHARVNQHYVDLFEYHNAVPVKKFITAFMNYYIEQYLSK